MLTLRVDHTKLPDVLKSLPVSQAILPRAVCFATSHPANHAICSFIDLSGYASGPIRRCLFIDYIINRVITLISVNIFSQVWISKNASIRAFIDIQTKQQSEGQPNPLLHNPMTMECDLDFEFLRLSHGFCTPAH